jgi:hypothetical protein
MKPVHPAADRATDADSTNGDVIAVVLADV